MDSFACRNVDIEEFLSSEEPKWKCSDFVLKMLEDGTFADLTFFAAGGGSVKAHRSVLTHVCPLLCESEIYSCTVDSCEDVDCNIKEHFQSSEISIDMSIHALKLFLLLLYTTNEADDVEVPQLRWALNIHFEELYNAVREYEVVNRLGFVLLSAMARHLTPDNCWRFYQDSLLAMPLYYKMRASEICYNYILGNYTDAIKSKSVLLQMKSNRKRLHRIMVHAESQAARQEARQSYLARYNSNGTDNIKDEEFSD